MWCALAQLAEARAETARVNNSLVQTLAELADVLIKFGAHNAINLDGGGSTALVLKDPGPGIYALANQPSDTSTLKLPVRGERAVIDVVGVTIN